MLTSESAVNCLHNAQQEPGLVNAEGAALDLTGLTNGVGWQQLCSQQDANGSAVLLKVGMQGEVGDGLLRRVLYNPPAI
eukprot:4282-Heterococcus_DN1.PRE.2